MSEELREAILSLLDSRHRADASVTVDDVDIVESLGLDIRDVQRQLDILESQGLTREANTFGGYSAYISPQGILAAERLPSDLLPKWLSAARIRRKVQETRDQLGISFAELAEAINKTRLGQGSQGIDAEVLRRFELGLALPSAEVVAATLDSLRLSRVPVEIRNEIRSHVSPIEKDLISRIAKSPNSVFELSPREFEEFVAELLSRMGLAVQLTPQTRDGGRDILATMKSPVGELLTIVECKKNSPHRPVGIDIIERFLYTIREKDRASLGLIATTSYFSVDAQKEASKYPWQLVLKDFEGLQSWLRLHGTYFEETKGGLWLPGYGNGKA